LCGATGVDKSNPVVALIRLGNCIRPGLRCGLHGMRRGAGWRPFARLVAKQGVDDASTRRAADRQWDRESKPDHGTSIPTTALGMRGDRPRSLASLASFSAAGVDTLSGSGQALEGRGPVEDWTDGCLAARAVIYPARRGASFRALNSKYPERGVRYSSQGSLRKGRRHLGADDRSLAALSARLVHLSIALFPLLTNGQVPAGNGGLRHLHHGRSGLPPVLALGTARCSTSSGGGLGIHQPGSNTRGGFFAATAPSGRARDRAMCPAAARSDRRAA
jgi:hypothetical protein